MNKNESLLKPFKLSPSLLNQYKQNTIHNLFLHPNKFTEIVSLIKSIPLLSNDQNFINKIISALKSKVFNLTGELVSISQQLSKKDSSSSYFDVELRIKYKDSILFTINLNKITNSMLEDINKLPNNSILYILNVKSNIVLENNVSTKIKFFATEHTKIFYKILPINDNEGIFNFPFDINQIYEAKNEEIKQKRALELNRININNNKITEKKQEQVSISKVPISPIVNKKVKNKKIKIDDIIYSDLKLKKIIQKASEKERNIERLLSKKTARTIYNVKNIDQMIKEENSKFEKVNVLGLITNIDKEPKVTRVEITSLNDSNKIILIHYPNSWNFKPSLHQIISIKNIFWKVNKNFEIIIENPSQNNVTIEGELNDSEFQLAKEFRFSSSKTFSSLISLIQPKLVRNIQKYLIMVKDIIKIVGKYDTNYVFHLYAKCLIDDGTFEAHLNLYDDLCAKFFGFDEVELKEIKENVKKVKNGIIYQKKNEDNCINVNLEQFNSKQYIVHAVPYSNIANMHYCEDEQMQNYFMNLGDKNKVFKNRVKNIAFINGDLFYQKECGNEDITLVPVPLLRALYFEEI